jgi:hypothetical protein
VTTLPREIESVASSMVVPVFVESSIHDSRGVDIVGISPQTWL